MNPYNIYFTFIIHRSALEIDPECSEAMNGIMSCATPDDPEAVRKQALNDPEVIQILQDPAMRHIFDRMDDPKARQEYLNNPEIASKLGKLIDAGLVTFR